MSTIVKERNLEFCFDDAWKVVKYDDHDDYREWIQKLQGSCGLDIIAYRKIDSLVYLIEVKDWRGYSQENQARMKSNELAEELGRKVRDSIAGVFGAYRRQSSMFTWEELVGLLSEQKANIRVLLWVEDDLPLSPRGRNANRLSLLIDSLKKRLAWLTEKVFVVNLDNNITGMGIDVTDLR